MDSLILHVFYNGLPSSWSYIQPLKDYDHNWNIISRSYVLHNFTLNNICILRSYLYRPFHLFYASLILSHVRSLNDVNDLYIKVQTLVLLKWTPSFMSPTYIRNWWQHCCWAPLHEECPKHHGHKGDPRVKLGTCGVIGERAQVIIVWVRASGVKNASHPRRLGVTRVRP